MGYTTEFSGSVTVEPPLNPSEIDYLMKFNRSRRMVRGKGQYFIDGSGYVGQGHDADVHDYNTSEDPQPGLWCQWVPSEDGTTIEWDGGEKFYESEEWMRYIIDHFLKPGAVVSDPSAACQPHTVTGQAWASGGKTYEIDGLTEDEYRRYFAQFSFDHVVNGEIEAQGEEYVDRWKLVVTNNEVRAHQGRVVYE